MRAEWWALAAMLGGGAFFAATRRRRAADVPASRDDECVELASEASFPASDPPAWTGASASAER